LNDMACTENRFRETIVWVFVDLQILLYKVK